MATMTDKKNGWQKIGGNELRCVLRKLSPAFAGRDCDSPSGRNIKVKDGTATLSGKGFTASTETTLQGEFYIPYEPMSRIAALCRSEDSLKVLPKKVGGCEVRYQKWRWLLVCETSWKDMNGGAKGDKEHALLRLPSDEFVRGLKAVTFAKANSSHPLNSPLHNVLLEVKDGKVFFVSTDGRRAALFTTEIDQAVDDAEIPLNGKMLDRLVTVIARDELTSVQVCYTDRLAIVELPDCTYKFARPSSDFVNWRNVLGEEDEVQGASVNCGELKWALNSVSVCVSDSTLGVEIGVDEGVVNIKAQDSGESSAEVKLHHSTTNCETVVNPSFLSQWLETIETCEPISFDLCASDTRNAIFATEGKRYLVCSIDRNARGS